VDRRAFLRQSAAAAAVAALAGCGTVPPSRRGTTSSTATTGTGTTGPPTTGTPTTGPPPTGTTSPARPPTAADWRSFGQRLDGGLVRPGDPTFAVDALLYDPVFDGVVPQAVAYCATTADVAATIAFARGHALPFAVRAGGHSYAGWSTSTGVVLDVTRMAGIAVAPGTATATATVGAGARLVDVYAACAAAGVAIPGGSCPTVGIAGLTLGGGIGVLGRKLGLTCDNLRSAEVVTAAGDVVTADGTTNSDLFWALRGAGAGNFGVVTSFTFATAAMPPLALFTLVYPWPAAPAVVSAWQQFAPAAPDELWSNCLLIASQQTPSGESPVARVTGVYVGDESGLEATLRPFEEAVGAQPFDRFVGSAGYLDAMLSEAGCEGKTVAECHLPSQNPAGVLTRSPFSARSDYLAAPLPAAGISTLLAAVEARQASPVLAGGGIGLDASGGAINRVPADATAFVHRDDLATVQYAAEWTSGSSDAVVSANAAWLGSTWQSMRPWMSGQAYQNYVDPALADWQQAYYGSNFPRLQQVKARWDPDGVFRYPQSIPPA
jgi:FAD/FMN-containing dehydrogenase